MIDRWRRKLGFNFFSHQTRWCEVFPFSSIYVISRVIGLRPILTIDNLIIDRITLLVHSQIKVASHNYNWNFVKIYFSLILAALDYYYVVFCTGLKFSWNMMEKSWMRKQWAKFWNPVIRKSSCKNFQTNIIKICLMKLLGRKWTIFSWICIIEHQS